MYNSKIVLNPLMISDLEPLLIVILTLLPSAEIGGPPGLALETVNTQNENLSTACSITMYSHVLHYVPRYFLYPL